MKSPTRPDVVTIGWHEYVDLPEWGLRWVRAKADTGARSSAIDVSHLEELPNGRVRFEVVSHRGVRDERRVIESDIVRRARVRSSFGQNHHRLFVETTMLLAGITIRIEVGLINREHMRSRMLLGRRSLEHGILVDPKRCYLHGRRRKKKKKEKDPT